MEGGTFTDASGPAESGRRAPPDGPAHDGGPLRLRSRETRWLAVERGVTNALARAADLREAAGPIARTVCEELRWACGACWIESPSTRELVVVGAWSEDDTSIEAFHSTAPTVRLIDTQVGFVRRAWSSGKPVWIENVVAEPSFSRSAAAARSGLHGAFAFPIVAHGQVLGVFEFFSRRTEKPDADLLEWTGHIGSQIGQFCLRSAAEARLRERENQHADIIELAAIGIALVDEGGRFVEINRGLCDLLGYGRDELPGMTVGQISHPEDRHAADGVRRQLRAGEIDSFQVEKRLLRKDGGAVWVLLAVTLQRDASGKPLNEISIFQDITARKQAESALQSSEQRFRNLVGLSSDWYWELDADLRFTVIGGRNTGGKHEELLRGRLAWDVPSAESNDRWLYLRQRLELREPFRDVEYTYIDRQGQRRYVCASGEPLTDPDGRFTGYRGVTRDITLRKLAEERIQYLATHDSLTGLPNRMMFGELLNHALAMSRRHGRRFAVLFIDLDRFKFINDSLGHEAGDGLLREVARRLKGGLRSSDIVARLGGDEFVMLLQELNGRDQAGRVARKLLSKVYEPIRIGGHECRVTASIGISLFPADAQDEASLMTHADIAMYHAKEEGKNNFQFYDSRRETMSLERLTLETRLRRAIECDEFSLHYQAKLDLATNAISGAEALLRWNCPELGEVTPATFIPVAEETGLILSIGKWVLRTACAQSVAWQRAGLPPVRVSVNLSPRQLSDPQLHDEVRAVLAETQLDPGLLELEVTESSVMRNVERALEVLGALKAMGVKLGIDDFGTGYSSLAQLKRFPIDTLKIDRSFIRELPSQSEDQAITKAIIAMGKTLKLCVLAEGVETLEQKEFLRAHGCDQMQGYHFSRPIAADQFAELLRTRRG